MSINIITSNSLIPIDTHFKVSAGPGAGKTHWLINHISQVLNKSRRLGSYRKIACITYTNVAVDTIIKRLGNAMDRVEVSTIHSFIYNNILKPYMSFIANDYDFNVAKMDGHDEHIVLRSIVVEWVDNHFNAHNLRNPYTKAQLTRRPENLKALSNWLSSCSYKFNGASLEIDIDNSKAHDPVSNTRLAKRTCLDILMPGLMDYKKLYWRKGNLHHEDVLYFGYLLIQKYPFILTVLRAKFPYFFIDEFQDTNPIQTKIIKLLAQQETCIGIIGDKAQSIYAFQGATPNEFDAFALPNMGNYIIPDNRRSTNLIVDVLNHIRQDIQQQANRGIQGMKPMIIVGSMDAAYAHAATICGNETLITLSRDNSTASIMLRQYNPNLPSINILDSLRDKDSRDRFKVMKACITAVDLGKKNRFKEAIKEMEKVFYGVQDKAIRKKNALEHLTSLLSKYSIFKDAPLMEFYKLVKAIKPDIPSLTSGAIKDFYERNSYSAFAAFVDTSETSHESRTIHKAKGDEFDNVLVILKNDTELNCLISPNLNSEEERIRYVAFSRAKERLFINIPQLDATSETMLSQLFDIVR